MIIYVHGMGRHKLAEKLEWDIAIFREQRLDSHMAFYSDLLPSATEKAGYLYQEEADFNSNMTAYFKYRMDALECRAGGQKLVGDGIQQWLLKQVTRHFIDDVYAYLYTSRRERILERVTFLLELSRSHPDGEPVVLVGHSLGSIVAYEALMMNIATVKKFITIGTPLGLEPIKAELRKKYGDKLAIPPGVSAWSNFSDPLDIVSFDSTIADDYRGKNITDTILENNNRNATTFYGPHSGTGYLSTAPVRAAINEVN